jgi:hypothetical protein
MGTFVGSISFSKLKYSEITAHSHSGAGLLWPVILAIRLLAAFFFIKLLFLLFTGGEMIFIQDISQSSYGVFSSKGDVFVVLPSIHPEKELSCLHEAGSDVSATRLECHHDDPLLLIHSQVSPDIIEEGRPLFSRDRPFRFFSRDTLLFLSFQGSSCSPPPETMIELFS